jgi:Trypsin
MPPAPTIDLALVESDPPAAGVPVLALFEGNEVGTELLLLGRGEFGNGRDGALGADHRLRCVTNRVDSADEHWLRLRFDPPPGGTALEGVGGGGGDSGGPALVRAGGRLRIAGVASWQEHAGPLGTYGCVEHYARVSSQVAWIRAVCGR